MSSSIKNQLRPLLGGLLILGVIAACSSSPTSTPEPPPSVPAVSVALATVDLAVGSNRVVFGLIDRDGMPMRSPSVPVRAIYVLQPDQAVGQVRDTATARFFQWSAGPQGVFSANLEFDAAGTWLLEVDTTMDEGSPVTARGTFEVASESLTPAIGALPPASLTPILGDVADLSTITSSTNPDPDLYRLSVSQGLKDGKPLMVVFATPAFCVSATCGPQVEIVSQLKERFSGQANFIHVEVFKNPHEIESGRPSGGFVDAVAEWRLPTEPWTFIMDKEGKVRAKFEGFVTVEELEAALREVLST